MSTISDVSCQVLICVRSGFSKCSQHGILFPNRLNDSLGSPLSKTVSYLTILLWEVALNWKRLSCIWCMKLQLLCVCGGLVWLAVQCRAVDRYTDRFAKQKFLSVYSQPVCCICPQVICLGWQDVNGCETHTDRQTDTQTHISTPWLGPARGWRQVKIFPKCRVWLKNK